jgi:hypothetical protein
MEGMGVQAQDRLTVVKRKVGFLREVIGEDVTSLSDGGPQGLAWYLFEIEQEIEDILEPAKAKEAA